GQPEDQTNPGSQCCPACRVCPRREYHWDLRILPFALEMPEDSWSVSRSCPLKRRSSALPVSALRHPAARFVQCSWGAVCPVQPHRAALLLLVLAVPGVSASVALPAQASQEEAQQ